MKLVRRFASWFLLAIGLVFALDTFLSLRQHLRLFEADLLRDERTLGRALAVAVERVWRDQGEEHALALVRAANDGESQLRVRLVHLADGKGTERGPDAPAEARETPLREGVISQVRDDQESERLYTYVPLSIPGERSAALEISESLVHERTYLGMRIRHTLLTALLVMVASGLVAWIVGVRVVGHPIRALVDKAQRIGAGDFSAPLVLRRGDELSQLAGELNAMASQLDAAAKKVAAESAARIATLEQLHHADRLTTVGKLAAGLAHELGTPLNVVSGRARMIVSGETTSRQETVKIAQIIVDRTELMTRLVRQLLDFARRRRVERRPTDVVQLVRQTAALLEPFAAQRGVKLHYEHTPAPIPLSLDAAQIQQALMNLVMNGIQASQKGGNVRLGVSSELAPDPASGHPPGCFALLEIRDDGPGIPPDLLRAIFDPFFTTKPVGEGTGLGLSVAYGIVQEHGGWIDVRSELGRGSCFRIWLPCEAREDGPDPDRR